jgi:hypothetical protein
MIKQTGSQTASNNSSKLAIGNSMAPELPSEFSLLIGRMQAVYSQFKSLQSDSNLNQTVTPEDINSVFGQLSKNASSLRRMLVVDD